MKKLLLTVISLCSVLFASADVTLVASLPFGADYWSKVSAYDKTLTSTNGEWTLVNFNNNNNNWDGFVKCGRKGIDSTGEIITAKSITEDITKVVLKIDRVAYPDNLTSTTLYVANNADFTGATTISFGTIAAGDNTLTIETPIANAYYKVEFVCTSASANGVVSVNGFELYTGEGDIDPDPDPDPEPADSYKTLAEWLEAKPAADAALEAPLTAIYQNGQDLWVTDGNAYALVYGGLSTTYANGDVIPAPVSGKFANYNGMPEFVPVASTFAAGTAGTAVAAVPVAINDLTVADLAHYIRLDNVSITADASDTKGLNFIASDGENTVVLRSRYSKTVTIPETTDATVYGFVGVYNETIQVYPILIEDEGETPDPDPEPEPTGDTATFNFTDPATLTPAQNAPVADGPVNVDNVTFTNGPVAISFYVPEDLQGKTKEPRLYLYKENVELRTYSGTSMTIAGNGVTLKEIVFDVNYDDSFNADATTGTVTAGKPATWTGDAASVTFNFTKTTKVNKMTVTYETGAGIETVETVDANAPAFYFDLQGRRVLAPANGLYIRVQNGQASKVVIR